MSDVLRVDSEDLRMIVSDKHDCLVRIDATGWLDVDDMENLRDLLNRAIERRASSGATNGNECG